MGDEAKTKDGFAKAHKVVTVDLVNNRVVPTSMEPRNAIGEFTTGEGKYTLHVSCQSPLGLRKVLSEYVFKVAESKIRVIGPDVGGGFGMKTPPYPEYLAVLLAARKVGRPVKWVGGRGESFLSDSQARDTVMEGALEIGRAHV